LCPVSCWWCWSFDGWCIHIYYYKETHASSRSTVTIGQDEQKNVERRGKSPTLQRLTATKPVFAWWCYQCGHGLTKSNGDLVKWFVMPIVALAVKRIGKQILNNVAKTGIEVAGDVIGGRNIEEMLKDRGLVGIKRTVAEIVDQSPPDKQRPQKKKKRPAPPPPLTQKQTTAAEAPLTAERR